MAKKKSPKASFPEVDSLLEGMQELLVDEYGNPLPPDHPQVKRVESFMAQINASMNNEGDANLPIPPHGNA